MDNFFSSNLKFLREKHNLSQEKLADKIGDKTHHTTIGRWEKGNREPSMYHVVKIAEIFKIPIADLIGKDLSIENNVISKEKEEQIHLEILKKALIEKGFMKEGEDLTEDNFNKLLEIYNLMKK